MRGMQQQLVNLGTISTFACRHRETKKTLCRKKNLCRRKTCVSDRDKRFLHLETFTPALALPRGSYSIDVGGSAPGVKRLGRKADRSPPSRADVTCDTNLHTVHKTTQRLLRTSDTTPSAEHHMQQYTICTPEDGHIDARNMQSYI